MSHLSLQQQLDMMKRATSTPDTNEDRTEPPMEELRDEPAVEPKDTTPPDVNTQAVERSQKETREDVLENALGDLDAKAAPDKKLLAANFEHFASGNFTTRAPLLTKKASGMRAETLREQVTRVLGTT